MRRNLLILLSLLAGLQAGCGRVSGSHPSPAPPTAPPNPPASGSVQVSVTPNPANVRVGSSQQFAANVTGTTNSGVTWSVNNVAGGNSTTGRLPLRVTTPPRPFCLIRMPSHSGHQLRRFLCQRFKQRYLPQSNSHPHRDQSHFDQCWRFRSDHNRQQFSQRLSSPPGRRARRHNLCLREPTHCYRNGLDRRACSPCPSAIPTPAKAPPPASISRSLPRRKPALAAAWSRARRESKRISPLPCQQRLESRHLRGTSRSQL